MCKGALPFNFYYDYSYDGIMRSYQAACNVSACPGSTSC